MNANSLRAGRGYLSAPRMFVMLFAALLLGRLAHVDVLWVDESYGLAAARAMLDGESLYRHLWFDKPPLYAWVYLLAGGNIGWPLRVLGSAFCVLCCGLAYGLSRRLWGEREARTAASLLAFFLLFGIPSATVSLAPDLLTIPFALGAVWLAADRRPAWAGFVAGAALLANAKVLFLLPVLVAWCWPEILAMLGGFAGGLALTPLLLVPDGAFGAYLQQVWVWGAAYSRDTPFAHPFVEGLLRTLNWTGFHAALVLPAGWFLARERRGYARLLAIWLFFACVAVAGGWRFYPRYYFAVLPVVVLLAARGLQMMPRRWSIVLLAVTLSVPAVRFGVPQIRMAFETLRGEPSNWSDLALFNDSKAAAERIRTLAKPGDTLLVWGYRPELNVLAGLAPGTEYLDSQPLTGVIADRHLRSSEPTFRQLAASRRALLTWSKPAWIADGLGPLNPDLAITAYPDLADWLAGYVRVGETQATVLYRRR